MVRRGLWAGLGLIAGAAMAIATTVPSAADVLLSAGSDPDFYTVTRLFPGSSGPTPVTVGFTLTGYEEVVSNFMLSGNKPLTGSVAIYQDGSPVASVIALTHFGQSAYFDLFLGAGSYLISFEPATTTPIKGDSFTETLQVSAIPEPATWAMMVFGFLGLGLLAYRRDRRVRGWNFRLS